MINSPLEEEDGAARDDDDIRSEGKQIINNNNSNNNNNNAEGTRGNTFRATKWMMNASFVPRAVPRKPKRLAISSAIHLSDQSISSILSRDPLVTTGERRRTGENEQKFPKVTELPERPVQHSDPSSLSLKPCSLPYFRNPFYLY